MLVSHSSVDMAQPTPTSVSEDDLKTMHAMSKEVVNLFAKERARANADCFHESEVDWQLSLTEVPVTLLSQPSIQHCGPMDAVFFMRMTEKRADGQEKLDGRVFLAPMMVTKTGAYHVPFILNTWPAMRPKWMSGGGYKLGDPLGAAAKKDEANLASYFEWCLDSCSMNQMPGLEDEDEEGAPAAEDAEMSNAAAAAGSASAKDLVEDEEEDSD